MVGGEHGVRLGGNAGQKRKTRLAGGGGQVAGQPRTDGELRSRVDGGVELARIAYRADTDDRFGHGLRYQSYGVEGHAGAQGDFQAADAARDQGGGKLDRGINIFDEDRKSTRLNSSH